MANIKTLIPEFDEIGADVVVRRSEGRVQNDRFLALFNCVFDAALVAVRPAEAGVRFGGGAGLDGALIEEDN